MMQALHWFFTVDNVMYVYHRLRLLGMCHLTTSCSSDTVLDLWLIMLLLRPAVPMEGSCIQIAKISWVMIAFYETCKLLHMIQAALLHQILWKEHSGYRNHRDLWDYRETNTSSWLCVGSLILQYITKHYQSIHWHQYYKMLYVWHPCTTRGFISGLLWIGIAVIHSWFMKNNLAIFGLGFSVSFLRSF